MNNTAEVCGGNRELFADTVLEKLSHISVRLASIPVEFGTGNLPDTNGNITTVANEFHIKRCRNNLWNSK